EKLAAGTLSVLIGTHALLEDDVRPASCTLAIIDEQQRFGVDQRAALLKKGTCPDALYLTATPIPRTLALALYGNLTLSYLKTRPKASAPRRTFVHDFKEKGVAYDAAREALERGERVFVVCPLVGEKRSEEPDAGKGQGDGAQDAEELQVSIESDQDMAGLDVHAAEEQARYLSEAVFADYEVGLVHGRMPAREKQQVMQDFRDGKIQVLVATTVIEVGIDVPEATVMIVEDADRFGLSQLHQLRGRVGRGTLPGEVHLISGTRNPTALERLAAMERTDDGFELATYDLSLRREGDILGNRQHGASVLKLVNVVRDGKMIEAAHADARAILEEDPLLESAALKALGREARLAFKRAEEIAGG
ncbi:MAG: ATP-dependent DNA helicase RecG, partial [Eggerthellaceae bacterium]|nr:ATP-dependent DNA helicase RecG [Eggerthellaceae bacterium]